MTRTLLFLAADAADDRWITVDEHAVVARGSGVPVADEVVAVAPADAVTLHWAALPARSPAQATAAARIVIAEASAAPVADLHVAVGNDGGDERPIAVVAGAAMVEWLSRMARDGIDPVAMVPAPMLMPAPAEGFIRAEMAGQGIVRGPASGFADEARLTDLLTGGVAPATMDREAIDAALVAGAAAPALDLRQGAFARRRRRGIDWALIRRAGVLALTILGVTLAIDLVRIAKYSFAADALEARAATLAATALPRGATIVDADRQLVERLTEVRGPGLGFAGTVAAAFDAVRGVPGAEITAIDFQPSGALRLSVATTRETEPTELKRRIETAGFRVQAGTF
ncbi:MAG TPA: type II secretion system protein GspL, partial [Sphingomonas sp.]